MRTILILNGPNLNMLGQREPDIYGTASLADLERYCAETAATHNMATDCRQSNHEGQLIDWIQDAARSNHFNGLIINGGGYTHTSVALHDALKILNIPVIEVHLSAPEIREAFRHHSYIAPVAAKTFSGDGFESYGKALTYLAGLTEAR